MPIKNHPTFDSTGHYKLNENHLFAFLHSDGFNSRLLNVAIFVTKSLELEINISFFDEKSRAEKVKHNLISKEVPDKILMFLMEVQMLEKLDFGYLDTNENYLEGAKSQVVLFLSGENTIGFHLDGGTDNTEANFTTQFGKDFYHFYCYLDKWKEDLYERIIEVNSCPTD